MFEEAPADLLQRKRRWLIALISSGLLLASCIIVGLGATVWRMQQTMSLVDSATVSDSAFEDMITRAILWGKLGLAFGTVAFAAYLLSFVMHQRAKQRLKTWQNDQRLTHRKDPVFSIQYSVFSIQYSDYRPPVSAALRRGKPSTVHRLPPSVYRPPPTAHRPPPTVHRPPSTAHRPPPMPSRLLLTLPFLLLTTPLPAATVWATGAPGITTLHFEKPPSPDATLVTDRITPLVILGRADFRGIFNLAAEPEYVQHVSPVGTEWAFAGLEGNPAAIGAADFAALNFNPWEDALGSRFALLDNILDRPAVVHLTEEDIYLDLTFTAWGGPEGTGLFAYTRTAPIPEPSVLSLLVSSAALLVARRRPRLLTSRLRYASPWQADL